ncbi:hypothetical protein [Lentzea atacamensis]|uniref:hypothetical protein n=1 Tax=Lentzea atacamensis TaxID=531938 RepID=UPI00147344BA|nr:hypothetical protein [Lentzea atacamensis]
MSATSNEDGFESIRFVLVTTDTNRPSSVTSVNEWWPVGRAPLCPHATPPHVSGSLTSASP